MKDFAADLASRPMVTEDAIRYACRVRGWTEKSLADAVRALGVKIVWRPK